MQAVRFVEFTAHQTNYTLQTLFGQFVAINSVVVQQFFHFFLVLGTLFTWKKCRNRLQLRQNGILFR